MTPDERQALIDRYRDGFNAVAAVLDGATDTELDARPAPEEWSAREVVHHLADSETMAYTRLRRLLAEDGAEIEGYDETEFARRLRYDRPVERSLGTVRAVRASSLELLELLDDDQWNRTGTHSESGAYGVETWLQIYAAHPYDHAAQIETARGSGQT